ncbi:MAG: YheT family hydrolase [Flavobacteriaceae bacterium]
MPLLPSSYRPPLFWQNGHASTIYAGTLKKVYGISQNRERLPLPDGDYIDLDWSMPRNPSKKVVLLLHGLEGNAQRAYILGSAKHANQSGLDACAINLRGCSGTPNLKYRSYHSGATEDITTVIGHIIAKNIYESIYILGYSLGGNLCLKYLGEGSEIPLQVKGAVGISVPCELHSACIELLKPKNKAYSWHFKRQLLAKLRKKQQMFPERITKEAIKSIQTLKDFDDIYTSKAHGFTDALDYYKKCSCRQFLSGIDVPSLIINAKNDSFLGPACYPYKEARDNPKLFLETPHFGGHVGFWGKKGPTYAEQRAIDFFAGLGKNGT